MAILEVKISQITCIFPLVAGNSRGEWLARDCALRQVTRYKALACTQLAPAELRPFDVFSTFWSTIRKSCREQPHRSDCIGRCCLDVMVLRHLHVLCRRIRWITESSTPSLFRFDASPLRNPCQLCHKIPAEGTYWLSQYRAVSGRVEPLGSHMVEQGKGLDRAGILQKNSDTSHR